MSGTAFVFVQPENQGRIQNAIHVTHDLFIIAQDSGPVRSGIQNQARIIRMHTVQSAWGSRPPDVHSPSLQQRLHGVVAAWPQGSVDKKDRIHALLKDRVAPLRWWRFSRI